jgi:YNFM family putative membrane transporter
VLTDPVLLGLYLLAALLMGAFVAVFNALGFRLAAPPYALSAALAGLVFLGYAFGSVVVMLAGLLGTAASSLALVVLALAVMTVGFFAAHGVASG